VKKALFVTFIAVLTLGLAQAAYADYSVTIKFRTTDQRPGLDVVKIEALNSECGTKVDVGVVGGINYGVPLTDTGGWDDIVIHFDVYNADLGCDSLRNVEAVLYELCPYPEVIPGRVIIDAENNIAIIDTNERWLLEGDFGVAVWYADTEKNGTLPNNAPVLTSFSSGEAPAGEQVNFGGEWQNYDSCNTYVSQVDATIKLKMNRKVVTASATLRGPCGNAIPVTCWVDEEDPSIIVVVPQQTLETNTEYELTVEGQDCLQGFGQDDC
jgi:hypothetical protein